MPEITLPLLPLPCTRVLWDFYVVNNKVGEGVFSREEKRTLADECKIWEEHGEMNMDREKKGVGPGWMSEQQG